MALPQNRKGVREVLAILQPLVIGKELEGNLSGLIALPPAKATKIIPGGNEYPGQEVFWATWTVEMTPMDPSLLNEKWYCDLTRFVNSSDLQWFFQKHFTSTKIYEQANPYKLTISAENRALNKLPMAVRIMDSSSETSFFFDWGKEQETPAELKSMIKDSEFFIPSTSPLYDKIVMLLKNLQPLVYQGGPTPEEPYEPNWPVDYQRVVDELTNGQYISVRVWSSGTYSDYRGEFYTQQNMSFRKVA